MLNARRSALYVAIIGLAFAAGEAGAACSPQILKNGVLVCGNIKPGSEICSISTQVQTPAPAIDGAEGFAVPFSPALPPDALCSVGDFPNQSGPSELYNDLLRLNTTRTSGPTAAPNDGDDDHEKPPKKGKKLKCNKNGFVVVNGVKTPCEVIAGGSLISDSGDPLSTVDELPGTPQTMDCKNNGKCTTTLPPILPTGLYCSDGAPPIDFTADPPFVVNTEVSRERPCTEADVESGQCASTSDTTFEFVLAWFGCYDVQGGKYVCENILDFPFSDGSYCTGEVTGMGYCDLPALSGTAICQVD